MIRIYCYKCHCLLKKGYPKDLKKNEKLFFCPECFYRIVIWEEE